MPAYVDIAKEFFNQLYGIIKLLTNSNHIIMNSYKFILKTLNVLSKSKSVNFSLIESVICLFTDSSVEKYFSLSNQSIFTEIISENWPDLQ